MDIIALSDIYGDIDTLEEFVRTLNIRKDKTIFIIAGDIGITLNQYVYQKVFHF
jgi:Icc-related predicted phosphoesterase